MNNLLRAGALAFGLLTLAALGGCATAQLVTGSAVQPGLVYSAANSFDVAQSLGAAYDRLPPCTTTISLACRTASGVALVDKNIRIGRAARNQLESFVSANPGHVVPSRTTTR